MSKLNIKIEPQVMDAGICIAADVPAVSADEVLSVRCSGVSCYRVVKTAAAGFTAVVYGMFDRVCRQCERVGRFFRAAKKLISGCRMSRLAFAGGLRL